MLQVAARRARRHHGQVAHDLQHFYPGQHRETFSSRRNMATEYIAPASRVAVCIFWPGQQSLELTGRSFPSLCRLVSGSPWETEQMFAREQRVSTDVATSLVPPSRSQPPMGLDICLRRFLSAHRADAPAENRYPRVASRPPLRDGTIAPSL